MSVAAISFLIIGCFVILLLFATIFKKHNRAIFWSGAIASFLALCFLFAFGIFEPKVGDAQHNAAILCVSILLLAVSGLLIMAAVNPMMLFWDYWKRKDSKADPHVIADQSSGNENTEDVKAKGTDVHLTEGKLKGVIFPRKIYTPLAIKAFTTAIEDGIISVEGTHLVWKDSKVLLAYMCGRIYCKDSAEKVPYEDIHVWKKGKDGFPNVELDRLFPGETNLGQTRRNQFGEKLSDKFEEIDKTIERSK